MRVVRYNAGMDEQEFRRKADAALEGLKAALIAAEDEAGIEVEEQAERCTSASKIRPPSS